MRTLTIIGNILKWIIIIFIVLFSVATFMGRSYGQTVALLLIGLVLAYWPNYFKSRWNKNFSFILRVCFIVVMLVMLKFVFKSEPKTSIYLNSSYENELTNIYNNKLQSWPVNTREIDLNTRYGQVHVLVCGNEENKPLIMLHAASMGAHSWSENLAPFLDEYCIYSIDNIGEGNKSKLTSTSFFPQTEKEIADLYSNIMDSLAINSAPVFGASNGGFIAQCLAYYYPEKVECLALFGPMGLTQLTNGSVFMLAASTMYPFQFIRDAVMKWALGEDEYCLKKYGDWFNCIMKGTIPSVAKPVPMTTEQKQKMTIPVLLFLGTNDRIVGDVEKAIDAASDYPNIQIEVRNSGHLISVEHRDFVNKKVAEFLHQK